MAKSQKPMGKGGTLAAPVASPLTTEEVEYRPILPLTFEQRIELKTLFDKPVFRQAWNNAQAKKPSIVPRGLDTDLGPQIGNNRLHQIQGWELFRAALLQQLDAPRPIPPRPQDNFPDSGTIESDMSRRLQQTTTK